MKKELFPLSKSKLILGIILCIISGELLKELIIFSLLEPYLNSVFEGGTAEQLSELAEYALLAILLIPAALFFVVGPVNASNKMLHQLNQKSEEQNQVLVLEKKRLDDMFSHHAAVMLIIDQVAGGKIVDANHAALAFYGYSREEFKSMTLFDINRLPKEELREKMKQAMGHRQNVFG